MLLQALTPCPFEFAREKSEIDEAHRSRLLYYIDVGGYMNRFSSMVTGKATLAYYLLGCLPIPWPSMALKIVVDTRHQRPFLPTVWTVNVTDCSCYTDLCVL